MAPTNDPREMRKRIHEMARYGTRLDDKESSSVSAAANVALPIMNWGESEGWSGEDTMTAIAYHALLRYEAAMDQLLNAEMLKVPNRVIFTPEKKT